MSDFGTASQRLSLTGKRWTLAMLDGRDGVPEDDALALIAFLKHSRGLLNGPQSAGTTWCDAKLFPDSEKAAGRVREAVVKGEKIGIFGDYDCDGVTASAQILRALRRRGNEPVMRLPHRVHDGYGLKPSHVDEFHAAGVTLLITVDTGISAHAAIDHANSLGINVIILDHHHLLTPPDAFAILHPALSPNFPHPHPAAAGVAFIFLQALENGEWKERDIDLSLATMGTVADLVLLTGHNRALVQEGLKAMHRLPIGPLRTFVESVSAGKALTSIDIAFRLAPRINAAGRMADPMLALKALLEGGELLNDLETLNSLRQDQTSRALDRALLELTPDANGELPAFLSIGSASYPHGILGLLAGKLTEKFGRPSMAVHISDKHCTASLRSPMGYNIAEALHRFSNMLISYGGHAQAAGATFAIENYITLSEALEKDARERIAPEALTPTLAVDAVLPASAVTHDFCNHLTSLEPFGQGNPEPLFLIENIKLENARKVGGEGKHLQATVGGCKLIGFGLGSFIDETSRPLDAICRIGMDTWNGRNTPQLFLVDMRPSEIQDLRYKTQEASSLEV
jgi:single-stranded-DNA-specific exonuclease